MLTASALFTTGVVDTSPKIPSLADAEAKYVVATATATAPKARSWRAVGVRSRG